MPSYYANTTNCNPNQMNVLFVVYPNIVLLDLVGPLQIFTHARKDAQPGQAYHVNIASNGGGSIKTNTLLNIDSDPLAKWLTRHSIIPIHTLIIIGGDGATDAAQDRVFVDQVRQLAERSTRVCSVCSGAIILAAAGLLDGCRAVTHWQECDRLAAQYPAVKVEVDPIYIKYDNIWTSAGITAGIDMSLAIIEEDLGKSAAIEMARSLVTPMVRSGGQSQFSAQLDRQAYDTKGRFTQLHNWLLENIQRKISVDDMAKECGMSSRNFSRRFKETMRTSPAKAVETIRLDEARKLLATSDESIKTIAAKTGFQDDERMRRAFLRHINTSPSNYRKQFRLHKTD